MKCHAPITMRRFQSPRALRRDHRRARLGLPEEIEASVLERLATAPRHEKRLLAAFGTAKLAGRNWLEASDFDAPASAAAARSGFSVDLTAIQRHFAWVRRRPR